MVKFGQAVASDGHSERYSAKNLASIAMPGPLQRPAQRVEKQYRLPFCPLPSSLCPRRALLLVLIFAWSVRAAEVIPPAPQNHFNDYAHVVSPAIAQQLNDELANFERQTSNQIVVAVFPKMQSDSSISDYCTRVFTAWKPGQKGKDNGAILFVFVQDHKAWIQTGYGLEGVLPDALCMRIIDQEITPRFRQQDLAGGLAAGISAMLAATRGEYKGTGQLVNDVVTKTSGAGVIFLVLVVIFFVIAMERSTVYASSGRRAGFFGGLGGNILFNIALAMMNSQNRGGGSGGGGGWGGGGSWGGGGGGGTFSGGGGSTGGGGAGGSW